MLGVVAGVHGSPLLVRRTAAPRESDAVPTPVDAAVDLDTAQSARQASLQHVKSRFWKVESELNCCMGQHTACRRKGTRDLMAISSCAHTQRPIKQDAPENMINTYWPCPFWPLEGQLRLVEKA